MTEHIASGAVAPSADTWTLGGKEFASRFILGSGKFRLDVVRAAVEDAGAQIVTLAVRRATYGMLCSDRRRESNAPSPSLIPPG